MANLLVALTINATDELLKEGGVTQSKKKVRDILTLLKLKCICIINVLCWPFGKLCNCFWAPREKFDDPKVMFLLSNQEIS